MVIPIILFVCHKPWGVTWETFGGCYRYYDIQIALTFSPFASVNLHYVGGLYWFFIIIRTCVYCITFTAAVILGIRVVIAIWCFKITDFVCCSNGEAVEIKNLKHLLKDIGLQLISIMNKLMTSSSALATFFKIGIIQRDPVKYAYMAFTVLSCFNAISSALYNAILLRWIVMKEDNKADDSCGSNTLEFLKNKAPSSHISFTLAVCINCGLIVLNSYILN